MTSNNISVNELENIAKSIRIDTLKLCHQKKLGHLGSSLSIIEAITALYFGGILEDNHFVLSKGHGCPSLYVLLAKKGLFSFDDLKEEFLKDDSLYGSHPSYLINGIELSTGSLGHGLPVAAGFALGEKKKNSGKKSFVLLSDGECDEGSTWEAVLSSAQLKLDNLVAIVDYNKIQAYGRTKDVMDLEPFADKWRAFAWNVREVDGHNFDELLDAFRDLPKEKNKPQVIIAHTVKGKGVSFMEDTIDWHYMTPSDEDLDKALKELG